MRKDALICTVLFAVVPSVTAGDSLRLDRFGDPLPDGAIFRLGTVRFRPASPNCQFALAPDGKSFATGEPREIRVWDSESGKPLWSWKLPDEATCRRLFFSRDGRKLMGIVWARRNKAFQFDALSGKLLNTVSAPARGIGAEGWTYLVGGKQLILGTYSSFMSPGGRGPLTPVLLDIESGNELWRLPQTQTMAISPDGDVVATTNDGCLTLWDARTGKAMQELDSAWASSSRLTWSANGKILAAVRPCQNKVGGSEIVCWDLAAKKEFPAGTIEHNDSFAISRNAQYLAKIDIYSRVEVWELKTGKSLAGAWALDNWIASRFPTASVWSHGRSVFAPDGTLLVRDRYHGLRRFDVASGRRLACPPGEARRKGIDLGPDGKTIVRPNEENFNAGPITFSDIVSGADRASFGQHATWIKQLVMGAKHPTLLSLDEENVLKVWDLADGKTLPSPAQRPISSNCFGFLDGGRTVVAVGEDCVARIWEARSGNIVRQFRPADMRTMWDWAQSKPGYVKNKAEDWLSLSADRQTLAIAGKNRIAVWDVATGNRLANLNESDDVDDIRLTVDGKSIVIRTVNNLIIQTVNGKRRWQFDRWVDKSTWKQAQLVASENGKLFAHVAEKLIVYETSTGMKCCSIALEHDDPTTICFAADNRRLLIARKNKPAICYDVDTG